MGFKVVPGALVECGLPDVRLWYNGIKRGAHTLPTVKAILHEITEVRSMRKQNPGERHARAVSLESREHLLRTTQSCAEGFCCT